MIYSKSSKTRRTC